jgi:acetyltransferase-like isoleucine patch superfamily enzyme
MGMFRILRRIYNAYRFWQWRRAGVVLGKDCRFAELPILGSEPYLISIGDRVAMASGVTFITHDGGTHVFRHQEKYKNVIKYGRIRVLDNCVIGERTILLPGVTVGPNSVVAAGSVVSRNVPPGVLAAGNPAKPVMTIEQYAEWSLATTPAYDLEEYRRNKRACLEKMHLRGSGLRGVKPVNGTASSSPVRRG